ncbi:AMP-dependent synthetase/ligase [Aspergillus floccosus]
MAPSQRRPSPNSLAYIIFTSGSTGQSKGVMIEHQSVVSRIRPSTNMCAAGTTRKSVAHMASLAFDAAIWEIYSALLNGGTVVCIDTMAVLDYQRLGGVFTRHRVRVAFITPALLKECIATAPATIAQLESLIVGGERFDPQVLLQARKLLRNEELIHAYGPTENTIYSTKYTVTEDEIAVTGFPLDA